MRFFSLEPYLDKRFRLRLRIITSNRRDLRVFSHKLLFSTLRATLGAFSVHHV